MIKKLFTLLLILVVPSLVFIYSNKITTEQRSPLPTPTIATFQVHQAIKSGDSILYESTLAALPDETAFDLLNRTQQVEIKQYSFGKLVTSVNGLANGTENKYWTYWINNQEASSSADSYKLKPNDLILWKFHNQ